MRGDHGPPDEKRWVGVAADAEHHQQSAHTTDRSHAIATRQCRCNKVSRRAAAWRDGFAYGFRDALRLAQRELDDPHAWVLLDRLADRYDLCGGDR
jgi:hypothetical protein